MGPSCGQTESNVNELSGQGHVFNVGRRTAKITHFMDLTQFTATQLSKYGAFFEYSHGYVILFFEEKKNNIYQVKSGTMGIMVRTVKVNKQS